MQNSCNPALISVGLRLGVDNYYKYFEQFGLKKRTGIDLPGEAATIMHKKEDMGNVELATVAFGQSFQITAIQLLTTASSIINGGNRITPHLGMEALNRDGEVEQVFTYPVETGIVSEETSATMRYILETVVAEGSGRNGQVQGFRVGGKTATSQTLPRGSGRYISSFIGFAPADDPQVIAIAIINNPQGVYYGGQVAAPIIRAQADGGLRWVCGKRVQHGVAACAAPAVGNRILLDCMKQIVQDLPINIEVVLRQTLRAIPDLTRTERQRFCTILRKKLYSETVYSALLDHITATGEGLTVHLHGVSEPLYFDLSGREKPSVQRTDG